MTTSDVASEILTFWFGELDRDGMADATRRQRWFTASREFDQSISARFGASIDAALAGELDHWVAAEDGLVALVLLLDQFPRNVFRNSPRAFEGDCRALRLATAAIDAGRDANLPTLHRVFLYMPFEHAEVLAAQELGLACYERLLETCPQSAQAAVADFRRYMIAHADVIRQFGRFPHRNAILGRTSTAAEEAFLTKHGGF